MLQQTPGYYCAGSEQEEERKKAAQRREAEGNPADATQTEANVEQAWLAELDHSTNDGQPLVGNTDTHQEAIASQSAGSNPEPEFKAVQGEWCWMCHLPPSS